MNELLKDPLLWVFIGVFVIAFSILWHYIVGPKLQKKKEKAQVVSAEGPPGRDIGLLRQTEWPRPAVAPGPASQLAAMAGADVAKFSAPHAEGEPVPEGSLVDAANKETMQPPPPPPVAPLAPKASDRIAVKRTELQKQRADIDAKLAKLDELESFLEKL